MHCGAKEVVLLVRRTAVSQRDAQFKVWGSRLSPSMCHSEINAVFIKSGFMFLTINLPVLTDLYLCSLVFFDLNINQEYIAKALAGGIRSTAPDAFLSWWKSERTLKMWSGYKNSDCSHMYMHAHTYTEGQNKKRGRKKLQGLWVCL